jgi:6-pyruvoyltetrahydropterin/6-carboxytetrahydropterin synthase
MNPRGLKPAARYSSVGTEEIVYSIVVETRFSATHRIRLHDGSEEPRHGHDWCVRVTFAKPSLDELGMVIDFAEAKKALNRVVQELDYCDLNDVPALRGRNPTTEVVAEWIFHRIVGLGVPYIVRVEVTEAPGCLAIFERGSTDAGCPPTSAG